MNDLIIFIGGFLGSVARFQVGRWIGQRTSGGFPFGTLFINTLGCMAIGVIAARLSPGGGLYKFLDIGFVAAFTTFSTFSYETWRLLEEKLMSWAFLNIVLNMGLGLTGVEVGLLLGRL
ncbi:MAG: fluoride efflux transporter CrcB [Firmicutes bacterium]|uniref:Fluoride-specific ion channel FluC n=1 Tax=Sulfobacillus benefaciens TaxID=453960 RepID=A0A2T2WY80_9FIRM|nr:fluoride efflux transporter CrcB [Bacillota bacterium]MCL5015246.1 fluoride efflux transporter CrcB [Bacillota bacterium]PSR27207.1 MAG: fluoride efflux transporter CrcB [Sulfobacillus benefaciens]HBQ96641.1 fluoride efflux transporter CrcB [Sulfobacillus sp.]